MARERFTITDMHSYGLVDEADSLNVKENALVRCMNMKFKHGRLVPSTSLGTKIGTSLYGTTDYNTCRIWQLLNGQSVYVSASDKMEYHWYDGSEALAWKKYPLPDWFGGFGKVTGVSGSNCIITGDDLGGTYDSGYNKFLTENSNPAKNLNKQSDTYEKDVVFFSKMTAAGMDIDEGFGTPGTLDPAKWTTISGTPTVAVGLTVSGGAAKSTTELTNLQNRVFYINNIAITTPSAGNAWPAGFFFYNGTTGLGYIVCITHKNLTAYPTTTDTEYRMRVYCGYVASETTYGVTTNLFNSSMLIYDEVVFDTTVGVETEDSYTRYNDLFGYVQGPWLNVGYGRKVQAAIPIEVDFTGAKIDFGFIVDANATIGPAVAGADGWNCVSTGILTQVGPCYVTKVVESATSHSVVCTSEALSLNDRGFVWGCHSLEQTDQVLRPSSEYLLRLTSDEPLRCYYGGIMPAAFPNKGEPTYYPTFCAWGGNDVAVFNGRTFLGGARLYARVIHIADGTGNIHYRWKEIAGHPTRVMWNVPYDIEDWSGGLAGWIENIDSSGKVSAIRPLRDVLMVYKTDAIFRLTPTGDPVTPFSVTTYSRTMGVPRARAVGDSGTEHYFTWNNQLWTANLGDLASVNTMVGIDSDYIIPLPYDHTIFCGRYASDSAPGASGNTTGLEGLAFNYKLGATYEKDMASIRDIDTNGNDWVAVENDGDVYKATVYDLDAGTLSGDSMYFVTPHLAFQDPYANKTIYTIDVFYKIPNAYRTYTLAWTLGPITMELYCQDVSQGTYTPTPELIGYGHDGYDLYRSRYNIVCTGTVFQLKVTCGKGKWSSWTVGESPVETVLQTFGVEVVRIEFELDRGEDDQKVGAL